MTDEARRRVWVVTECYPRPDAWTHCIFSHRQLKGVRGAGWDVSVLVPNGWYPPGLWRIAHRWRMARRTSIPKGFVLDGISVSDLRYRNLVPNRLNRPREYGDLVTLALDRYLIRAGATRERDVLLAQFALPFGPVVRRVALRRGLGYAVYLRGDDVWIWPHTARDGVRAFVDVVRGAALLLSVSEALLREAQRLAQDDLPQGVVISNGIDLALFHPVDDEERRSARAALGLPAAQSVVVCVGTASERKGWRELVTALGQLGISPPVLLAVSTGYGNLDLEQLRDTIAPHVPIVRYRDVDASALARIYQAADVFCLPTHGEGMSNAVLEALASGLPVITTPVGGHPEVVETGINGELVPVHDVATLTALLRALLGDPARRVRMGRAARRRAEAIGTSDENGARVAKLFDAVLHRAPMTPDLTRSSYAPLVTS